MSLKRNIQNEKCLRISANVPNSRMRINTLHKRKMLVDASFENHRCCEMDVSCDIGPMEGDRVRDQV